MNIITKESLRVLRLDINAALAMVGVKHGVRLTAERALFLDKTATFKLEVAVIDHGRPVDKDMETLRRYLDVLNLSTKDLDKVLIIHGLRYQLAGYNPRRYSKPFILTELDTGRRVVCRSEPVESAIREAK